MRGRFVTWNVHSFVGSDGRHDPRRAAAVLAELEADVIGLQEVDGRHAPVEGQEPLAFLAGRLGLQAIPGPNLRDGRGEFGNGLLTRFEVLEVRRLSLAYRRREPRGAIDAQLRTAQGVLRVLVTHLGLRSAERRAQIEQLRRALLEGPRGQPTVLLGDLNEWRPARFWPQRLVPDPFPAVVLGRTYPARAPVFLLDRILIRPRPRRQVHEVVRSAAVRAASDHLPLMADIEWSGTQPAGPDLQRQRRSATSGS